MSSPGEEEPEGDGFAAAPDEEVNPPTATPRSDVGIRRMGMQAPIAAIIAARRMLPATSAAEDEINIIKSDTLLPEKSEAEPEDANMTAAQERANSMVPLSPATEQETGADSPPPPGDAALAAPAGQNEATPKVVRNNTVLVDDVQDRMRNLLAKLEQKQIGAEELTRLTTLMTELEVVDEKTQEPPQAAGEVDDGKPLPEQEGEEKAKESSEEVPGSTSAARNRDDEATMDEKNVKKPHKEDPVGKLIGRQNLRWIAEKISSGKASSNEMERIRNIGIRLIGYTSENLERAKARERALLNLQQMTSTTCSPHINVGGVVDRAQARSPELLPPSSLLSKEVISAADFVKRSSTAAGPGGQTQTAANSTTRMSRGAPPSALVVKREIDPEYLQRLADLRERPRQRPIRAATNRHKVMLATSPTQLNPELTFKPDLRLTQQGRGRKLSVTPRGAADDPAQLGSRGAKLTSQERGTYFGTYTTPAEVADAAKDARTSRVTTSSQEWLASQRDSYSYRNKIQKRMQQREEKEQQEVAHAREEASKPRTSQGTNVILQDSGHKGGTFLSSMESWVAAQLKLKKQHSFDEQTKLRAEEDERRRKRCVNVSEASEEKFAEIYKTHTGFKKAAQARIAEMKREKEDAEVAACTFQPKHDGNFLPVYLLRMRQEEEHKKGIVKQPIPAGEADEGEVDDDLDNLHCSPRFMNETSRSISLKHAKFDYKDHLDMRERDQLSGYAEKRRRSEARRLKDAELDGSGRSRQSRRRSTLRKVHAAASGSRSLLLGSKDSAVFREEVGDHGADTTGRGDQLRASETDAAWYRTSSGTSVLAAGDRGDKDDNISSSVRKADPRRESTGLSGSVVLEPPTAGLDRSTSSSQKEGTETAVSLLDGTSASAPGPQPAESTAQNQEPWYRPSGGAQDENDSAVARTSSATIAEPEALAQGEAAGAASGVAGPSSQEQDVAPATVAAVASAVGATTTTTSEAQPEDGVLATDPEYERPTDGDSPEQQRPHEADTQ